LTRYLHVAHVLFPPLKNLCICHSFVSAWCARRISGVHRQKANLAPFSFFFSQFPAVQRFTTQFASSLRKRWLRFVPLSYFSVARNMPNDIFCVQSYTFFFARRAIPAPLLFLPLVESGEPFSYFVFFLGYQQLVLPKYLSSSLLCFLL